MIKNILILVISLLTLSFDQISSKEVSNQLCNLRGYEIIFPYEAAVSKIRNQFQNKPSIQESELEKFKKSFEENFQGIPLYKEAGCSNARLSEYLNCLISTDGKDCRIYYTQMRIVD